jgi:isopentenyl diphosphate isomerase/L-lactate dehydrogenase-like FMN-dependent dehydrogenase
VFLIVAQYDDSRETLGGFEINILDHIFMRIGMRRNRADIEAVQLRSELLSPFAGSELKVNLFGHSYNAPFGIAPIGLQGLMWPKSPEILAKAAAKMNIPCILSTVSSSSLEHIAEVSQGNAWFQLYNPSDEVIRRDLLKRIVAAQYRVLVVTVDVPTFGYRPRDIRNGLAMPPKMNLTNILQMLSRPPWLLATAKAGIPQMETLKPYMPKGMPSDQLAAFMNKTVMGRVDIEGLRPIRDQWKGPLIIKGLISESDVAAAIQLGADGVVMSNHGARQLDLGESPVKPLQRVSKKYAGKIKFFMDSDLRSGSNIAAALACGADFVLLGRPFVYSVGALGNNGGIHMINLLTQQLSQIMNQLGCEHVADLLKFLVDSSVD